MYEQEKDYLEDMMDYDFLWLSDISNIIREIRRITDPKAVKAATLELIKALLEEDFIGAGRLEFIASHQVRVRRWALSPEEVVAHIDKEWDKLETPEPFSGDICAFDRMDRCLPPLEAAEGGKNR